MSLLVKIIAVFVGLWILFRIANGWMAARIDPNRAVERARRSPGFAEPPRSTERLTSGERPPARGGESREATASLTFNLPEATPSPPAQVSPTPDPTPPGQPAPSGATFTPAAATPSVVGGRVPSLDSIELVPTATPVGLFARKPAAGDDPILHQLRSIDPAVRRQGLDALRERRDSMPLDQAHRLLAAAGGELPEVDDEEIPVAEAILAAAEPWVGPEEVGLLRSLTPQLPPGARAQALALLATVGSEPAARAWVECLERSGAGGPLGTRQIRPWSDALEHGDVFFPALLDADLPTAAQEGVLLLSLQFLEGGAFPPGALDSLQHTAVELWRETHEELPTALDGPAWSWTDRGRTLRRRAGILLDLMGFLDDAEADDAVASGLRSDDPHVRLFSVRARLRRGGELTADDVAPAAASPETRRALYDFLKDARKVSLMPRGSRTQAAMAEADLVRWLGFPTELGHRPDDIESAHVVTVEGDPSGPLDWHLLRFRSSAPKWSDAGWMEGVSGPWRRKEGPAGRALSEPTTAYRPWSERSPEEHRAALRERMEAWAEGTA